MRLSAWQGLAVAELHHVGAIVRDLDRSVELWESALGVGPWAERQITAGYTYRNTEVRANLRVGFASLHPIQLEVIQPLEPGGAHEDFVAANGEGLNHIAVDVPDAGALVSEMVERGASVIFDGRTLAGNYNAYVTSVHTQGIIFELRSGPHLIHPAPPKPTTRWTLPAGASFRTIGFLVRDLDESAERMTQIFGVGPWQREEVSVDKCQWRGEASDCSFRQGLAQLGTLELKLLQPVAGQSAFLRHLDTRGEGIHHLEFTVDDFEACSAALSRHGVGIEMSGLIGTRSFALTAPVEGAGVVLAFSGGRSAE